jgi:hypothetical protein
MDNCNRGFIQNGSILRSAGDQNIVNVDLGELGIITENLQSEHGRDSRIIPDSSNINKGRDSRQMIEENMNVISA